MNSLCVNCLVNPSILNGLCTICAHMNSTRGRESKAPIGKIIHYQKEDYTTLTNSLTTTISYKGVSVTFFKCAKCQDPASVLGGLCLMHSNQEQQALFSRSTAITIMMPQDHHLQVDGSQKPKKAFACNKCDKSYVRSSGLSKHTRLYHS